MFLSVIHLIMIEKEKGGICYANGLVLEGGGMRGWYTAGVLTALNENDIAFPTVYGISAGACNALAYVSRQNTREYTHFPI